MPAIAVRVCTCVIPTGEADGKVACDGDGVTEHYDAVVIGSGAGGGTLARTLANAIRVGEHLVHRLL